MVARTTPRRQRQMSLSHTIPAGAYEARASSASDAPHGAPLRVRRGMRSVRVPRPNRPFADRRRLHLRATGTGSTGSTPRMPRAREQGAEKREFPVISWRSFWTVICFGQLREHVVELRGGARGVAWPPVSRETSSSGGGPLRAGSDRSPAKPPNPPRRTRHRAPKPPPKSNPPCCAGVQASGPGCVVPKPIV